MPRLKASDNNSSVESLDETNVIGTHNTVAQRVEPEPMSNLRFLRENIREPQFMHQVYSLTDNFLDMFFTSHNLLDLTFRSTIFIHWKHQITIPIINIILLIIIMISLLKHQ